MIVHVMSDRMSRVRNKVWRS